MTYNRITAEIGESRRITTRPVSYQYDTVQILMLTAAEGVELPEYYQVDFCVIGDEDTVTMVGSLSGGATIPDGLLRQGENLVAYLVLTGAEGDVQTRYEITIPVNERPTRSGIELSDDQQAQVDSLIEALNDGVDRAEAAVEAVQDMGVEAETLAAGSAASVEKKVDPETGAVTLTFGIPRGSQGNPGTTPDFQIGTVETLPATSPATATITGTPAEPVLNLGIPQGPKGDPGSGGTTDYRELENKPQINGHTLNGNQSASDLGLGTYSKPGTGIPKTDLASDVQQSLGKADSALQSAPVSSVAGKTGDVTLAAGDVSFDDSATYAAGSVGAELSAQSNAIDQKQDAPSSAGTAGQVLGLDSNLDPVWVNNGGGSGGAVDDVQINGTSIVQDGVANIPKGSNTSFGLLKTPSAGGLFSEDGSIYINQATSAMAKTGNQMFYPLTPYHQHEATFYGLAKAAGDSTQSASSNPVGTYTEEAKAAIQSMLGIDVWNTVELSEADWDSDNHMILFDAGNGKKIKDAIIIGQLVNDGAQTSNANLLIGFGNNPAYEYYSVPAAYKNIDVAARRVSFATKIEMSEFTLDNMGFRCANAYYMKAGGSNNAAHSVNIDTSMPYGETRATNFYWNYNDPRYIKIVVPQWSVEWAAIKIMYTLQ